mgnify:CR=1 FL=1|tara:strand:+ start:98 stop:1444 length:1347 start_codon:yes stop_codon:yes gene_type:complete
MLTVHQHWDPLKVCAVGRSYPPEFYSRIKNPRVRNVLERIAIETEEDYQKLISKLEEFNVTVLRTDISEDPEVYINNGVLNVPPPMCPRDHTAMVGNTFYMPGDNYGENFDVDLIMSEMFERIFTSPLEDTTTYSICKEIEDCIDPHNKVPPEESFLRLKKRMKRGRKELHHHTDLKIRLPGNKHRDVGKLKKFLDFKPMVDKIIASQTLTVGSNFKYPNNKKFYSFTTIKNFLEEHNVPIVYDTYVNTASMTRIGKDLFFSSMNIVNEFNKEEFSRKWKKLFPDYNVHPVTVTGHSDACFCPVKPGLIISLEGMNIYEDTFPDWEVVHLPGQSWTKVRPFLELKKRNKGKWWIPGEENNDELTDYVEKWLSDWVTYVEETVFDVNMLVIDEHNVICNGYNKQVFDAFERYNITPHIVNFRHRYFWDGGLHCITSDIAREGEQKNLFA